MRIWQIKEQLVEDPSTKLRLEFSSVYTDEVNAGNEPPLKDELLVLRLWTSDRTRVASFLFERNGRFVRCEVEPLPAPAPVDPPGQGVDVSMTAREFLEPQTEPTPATLQEAMFGKAAFSGL